MRQGLHLGSIKKYLKIKKKLLHKDNGNSNLRIKSTKMNFYNKINNQNINLALIINRG